MAKDSTKTWTKGGKKRKGASGLTRRKKSATVAEKDYLKADYSYFKISLSKDRKSINFENIG